MSTRARLFLIDGSSQMYRAYHAMRGSGLSGPGGKTTHAVYIFVTMLRKLMQDHDPRYIAASFDLPGPTFRSDLATDYKANRSPMPPDLAEQIPWVHEACEALGVPILTSQRYEADDVIGTLAAREPGPIEVATGDRDLFQVIDDARPVRVLYTGRGVAKLEVYDNAVVQERYGVPAASYADFAALRGDPSDGLPGVNGIGDKSAARLVTRYGSLAGILAAVTDPAAGFAPGLRTKLVAAADYLAVAPTVVRVATGVPLPPLEPALPDAPRNPQRVAELTERWGLSGSVRRLTEALALTAAQR